MINLFLLFALASEIFGGIIINENSSNRFSFEWFLSDYDTISNKNHNKKSVSVYFKESNISIIDDNGFFTPGQSLFLGMPTDGEIDIDILPQKVKTINLNYPLTKKDNESSFETNSDLVFRSVWISQPQYTGFDNIRAAKLVIRPFVYDSVSKSLKILLKAQCIVKFPVGIKNSKLFSTNRNSDKEKMLKNLLVNYEVACGWKKRKLYKRASSEFPLNFYDNTWFFTVGDGNSGFNEGTTYENGIMKITGKEILKLFGNIDISQLTLYGSYKGELPEKVPEMGEIPDGVIEIPMIRFDRNDNGKVDNDDYFLAYVTGASDWSYDISKRDFIYALDRYDDCRRYWITKSRNGLSIEKHSGVEGSGDTLNRYENRILFKKPVNQLSVYQKENEGGLDWVWVNLNSKKPVLNFDFDLPGIDPDFGGSLIVKNTNLYMGKLKINLVDSICGNCEMGKSYPINNWGNYGLTVSLMADSDKSASEIRSIQINYQRKLEINDSTRMVVFSPVNNNITHFCLDIKTDELLYIFRIPSDEQAISLIDTIQGVSSYIWSDSGNVQYFICTGKRLLTLPSLESVSKIDNKDCIVNDIRNPANLTDFLIISHPDFINEAQKLVEHKKNRFVSPKIVSIEDIYLNFSGGDTDPSAIRNFLAYVKRKWNSENLLYVLIIGDGHFDYKKIRYNDPNYIPPFYTEFNVAKDDFFSIIDPDFPQRPQFVLGRLPCKSSPELSSMIKKIIETENPEIADYSEWRNRILFVADDDMQGDEKDPISNHHISSDNVSDVIDSIHPSISIRKVYLYEYKWNSANEKPQTTNAIINEINNGVAYVNFLGHGDFNTWTDERVLIPANVGSMYNSKRYPVVSSFSCSVGKFDIPYNECLSTALVKAPDKGAVTTISSTRKSNASSNEQLAKSFYCNLFDSSSSTVGMALMKAKFNGYGSGSYVILGDPSIRFTIPERVINLNVKNLDNKSIDTLKALQQIEVEGSITDNSGSIDTKYGSDNSMAFVYIGLFNPSDTMFRKDGGKDMDIRYKYPGKPVFLGKTSVKYGEFSQQILLPRNLVFEKHGVKLTAYAWNNRSERCAFGSRSEMIFCGTETSSIIDDTSGPLITLRDGNENKSRAEEGAEFNLVSNTKCELDFFDESGIDARGTGPDEGIILEIPGVIGKRNINNTFQFKQGDLKQGFATVMLDETLFKTGSYKMSIYARDMLGNISKSFFKIKISGNEADFGKIAEFEQTFELKLDRVFNCPNPVRMGKNTCFYFFPFDADHKWNMDFVKVTIKIYTLSGKIVRVIRNAYNGIVWNGRDQTGNLLGPNIYLYQISAYSRFFDKKSKSKIKKLVIHPPR